MRYRVPHRSAATQAGLTPVLDCAPNSCAAVTFLLLFRMDYQIDYYSEDLQGEILALPDTLAARYIVLTRRMEALGPNLGEPHTKAFGQGLFELRLKGAEGIARVFYCTVIGKRIFMLHCFVKKSQKTPQADLNLAINRMKEVKRENS